MYDDNDFHRYDRPKPPMDKSKIIIVLLIVLLVLNTVQLVQIKDELETLRHETNNMYNNIYNRVGNVENALYRQTNEMREILNEQEALFASSGVDVTYQDKKLIVAISAVPKELKSNETVWVSIAAGEETFTQQLDANGQAIIMLEPTVQSFTPTLQIKSPTGIKQQVLDEVSTIEFMSAYIEVFWNDALAEHYNLGHVLEFYLYPWNDTLPFAADEIYDIYLIVSNNGVRGAGSVDREAPEAAMARPVDGISGTLDTVLPEGERVEVVMMEDSSNSKALIYYADLTEFIDRADDIEYDVHLVVETVFGLTYSNAGYEPLASFCFDKDGGHQSANNPLLAPTFTAVE